MSKSTIELSLENLDDIQHMLILSYENSGIALGNILSTPENRKVIHLVFEQMSGYLLEVSHVDSFLQYCDLDSAALTPNQQKSIIVCQQLCKDLKASAGNVLQWAIQLKSQFNDSNCHISDDVELENVSETVSPHFIENETSISTATLKDYQQYRNILKEMHQELLLTDPKNMIETSGRRLNVSNGKQMFIETEHEMNILMDYGLFQYRKNGDNIVERYYQKHYKLYSGQKLNALVALKNARFSVLKILKPFNENGLVVLDVLTNETFLMIDKGLHQLAKLHQNYVLVTHYLRMPEFIMTTGASTPVSLDSPSGKKIWTIFEHLIRHSSNETILNQESYYQCITDLFRIIIHDNIAKKVTSRSLPMSYNPMQRHI